ncbi:hypothetical protein V1Y59_17855 [Gordonia sp. PKS22-38]|uniref:Uncharacterized protein n=1 Tax=Gordonia prachuapensis TaxID=3115651 RepID=A0ABU7MXB3_9ACTN|nr:hypothetical protein [Gordonia sp. PKS22-38]
MSPAYRIGGFLAAMAVVFALSFGVGRVVDPVDSPPPAPPTHQQHAE